MSDAQSTSTERWSRPVGIISLCVAILWGLWTFLELLITLGLIFLMLHGEEDTGSFTAPLLQSVFGLIASLFLLSGGVLLLRRRPFARELHLVYAALALLVGLTNFLPFMHYVHQVKTILGNDISLPVWQILKRLSAFIYPIFVLIWFFREKVREDVESCARPKATENAP